MYVSLFFFFKQKTAYEMRISDWSSDVCSSDFSSPGALEATLDACIAAKTPIVIGTTGIEERHHYLIDDAAKDIAVLQTRSGERRVGKECVCKCRSRWSQYQ